MICPSCHTTMQASPYEEVSIASCPKCQATWLDHAEIHKIIQTRAKDFSESERLAAIRQRGSDKRGQRSLHCPICQDQMLQLEYAVNSKVYLDRCPRNHGLFLDGGELEQVQIVMEEILKYSMASKSLDAVEADGALRCPRDGKLLAKSTYETETIDRCSTCGGVWCDDEELGRIVRCRVNKFSLDQEPDLIPDGKSAVLASGLELIDSLNCLVCGNTMRRVNYLYNSGIIIDRCTDAHGVWLDQSELERIQIFVERWDTQKKVIHNTFAPKLKAEAIKVQSDFDKAESEGSARALRKTLLGKFLLSLYKKNVIGQK